MLKKWCALILVAVLALSVCTASFAVADEPSVSLCDLDEWDDLY